MNKALLDALTKLKTIDRYTIADELVLHIPHLIGRTSREHSIVVLRSAETLGKIRELEQALLQYQ